MTDSVLLSEELTYGTTRRSSVYHILNAHSPIALCGVRAGTNFSLAFLQEHAYRPCGTCRRVHAARMRKKGRRKLHSIVRLEYQGRIFRRCNKCFRFRQEDRYHFQPDKRYSFGYRSICLDCAAGYSLTYYHKQKEQDETELLLSA